MSHSIPPIPPNSSSPRDESRHDEWIAVVVALLAMGGIFFWSVGQDIKFGTRKFADPNPIPAPEASISDNLNLSQALEESFAQSRDQVSLPQPGSDSENSSVIFPPQSNVSSRYPSTGTRPGWGFTPFFFAPRDEAASVDTEASPETEQAAQPDTEASPETEQAAQPDTEASPETEQAAQPDTEASPETEQAAQPDTEVSPETEQAAQPDTDASETEQAAQPDTDASETEQAAQPDTDASETEQAAQPDTDASETEQAAQPDTDASPEPEEETATQLPIVVIPDVSEDYWAEDFIQYTTQNKIVDPYPDGTFKPDQPVTRAELADQIENALVAKEDISAQSNYKDVDESTTAQQAITDVTETGFMSGYPGDIFRPEQSVPRVQVLVALASGLDLQTPRNPEKVLQETFVDADQIPAWAVEQVAAATEAGLVVNHPEIKSLNPNEPATRAEVSAMIYQALVKSGETDTIPSDYIVKPEKGILPF